MMPMETITGLNGGYHNDLSDLKLRNGRIYFPAHYYEDYFIDFFEEFEIEVDTETWSIEGDKEQLDTLHRVRSEAYSAMVWYDALENFTYRSVFIPIRGSIEDALRLVTYPAFVKLDTVSAKDTQHNGVYTNAEEAISIFNRSERIRAELSQPTITYPCHSLFVREIDEHADESREMRGFIYQSRATAVSCEVVPTDDQRAAVEKYLQQIAAALPYRNAVVDIALRDSGPRLIEVNSFGADCAATAGAFNWREDYITLHTSDTVTWRGKKEFQF